MSLIGSIVTPLEFSPASRTNFGGLILVHAVSKGIRRAITCPGVPSSYPLQRYRFASCGAGAASAPGAATTAARLVRENFGDSRASWPCMRGAKFTERHQVSLAD